MKERVITLGESRNLVGILSEPDEFSGVQSLPAILLLNAGMVHRVGPFRLNTLLARKLAAAGYTILRLDLAGIGDSEIGQNALPQDDQMIKDIGIAINYFQQVRQIERIVPIGICTGADNAHKAAVFYKQITGAIFLDGYSYPTKRFYYNRLLPVVANPKRLVLAIIRRLLVAFSWFKQKTLGTSESIGDKPSNLFIWHLPDKNTTQKDLEGLLKRKTSLCYIYTGGSSRIYNYLNQFRQTFENVNFGSLLTEHYFPEMDHTYILSEDRDKLMQCILSWIEETYNRPSKNND